MKIIHLHLPIFMISCVMFIGYTLLCDEARADDTSTQKNQEAKSTQQKGDAKTKQANTADKSKKADKTTADKAKAKSKKAKKHLIAADSREDMSEFELNDYRGRLVSFEDFEDQVVVVNFWATWCEPCKQELPHLNRMYKEMNEQGLQVLAISTDGPQTVSQVGRFARKWSFHTLLDTSGEVAHMLNPRNIAPYTIITDKQGRIAYVHQGYYSGDEVEIEQAIKNLLAEKY